MAEAQSDIIKADQVAIGELVIEPWSGVVARVEDIDQGPRKGTKAKQALLADEIELHFGSPANCGLRVKRDRLMRRKFAVG